MTALVRDKMVHGAWCGWCDAGRTAVSGCHGRPQAHHHSYTAGPDGLPREIPSDDCPRQRGTDPREVYPRTHPYSPSAGCVWPMDDGGTCDALAYAHRAEPIVQDGDLNITKLPAIRHKFKRHPLGRDFCTKSILVSRAVYRKGLTLPEERRYCGEPAASHEAK